MAPLPSRKELECMKRIELQNLCKEYGVRANLKTENMIDLLVEIQSAPTPALAKRSSSTARQSSRAASSSRTRTMSVIVHDVEGEEPAMDTIQEELEPEAEDPSGSPFPKPVRTRKSKDSQAKLGVGRPKAAGGSGPRAVTKSTSVPRGRRAKSGRTMSGVEATIPEEAEAPSSGPTRAQSEQPTGLSTFPRPSVRSSSTPPFDISQHIKDALRPLQVRVDILEEELRNTQQRNQELERIQAQLDTVTTLQQRYDSLEAEVRELRSEKYSIAALTEEFKQLKASLTSHPSPIPFPTTPEPRTPRLPHEGGTSLAFPSAFRSMGFHPSIHTSTPTDAVMRAESPDPYAPGPSLTMLGKRPRSASSEAGNAQASADATLGENEEQLDVRPEKKRAKVDSASRLPPTPGPCRPRVPTAELAAQLLGPRIPTFTIFQGPETQVSTPHTHSTPPMNPIPEVYRPLSPPGAPFLPPARTAGTSRTTSSATNTENQRHTYDVSIFGGDNGNEALLRPIPFPEAPPSPSPAGHTIGYMNQLDPSRTDPFKEFGLPSPRRPSRIASGSNERASGMRREVTNNDVAAGLGLTMVRTGSPAIVESTPSRKTLYGTELEGDSRFGDFGVEGIGSGFWSMR